MSEPFVTPPDPPPECQWCDGSGLLEVVMVRDAWEKEHALPDGAELLVACARCLGTGAEPEPHPDDLALERARLNDTTTTLPSRLWIKWTEKPCQA